MELPNKVLSTHRDQFLRHYDIALAISEILHKNDEKSLLDVGGAGSLLPKMLPDWQFVSCDMTHTPRPSIKANALHLPFCDQAFPVVTSIDVLEHLPASFRPKAIAEMVRVARDAVVLTCPYWSEANIQSEQIISEIRKDHPDVSRFLAEHKEHGLPRESELLSIVEQFDYPIEVKHSCSTLDILFHHALEELCENVAASDGLFEAMELMSNLLGTSPTRDLPTYRVVLAVKKNQQLQSIPLLRSQPLNTSTLLGKIAEGAENFRLHVNTVQQYEIQRKENEASLSNLLRGIEQDREKLRSHTKSMEAELRREVQTRQNAEMYLEKVKAELQRSNKYSKHVESENLKAKAAYAVVSERAEARAAEIERAGRAYESINRAFGELRDGYEKLATIHQNVKRQLAELSDHVDNQQAELLRAGDGYAALEAEYRRVKARMNTLDEAIIEKNEYIASLEKQLHEIQEQYQRTGRYRLGKLLGGKD